MIEPGEKYRTGSERTYDENGLPIEGGWLRRLLANTWSAAVHHKRQRPEDLELVYYTPNDAARQNMTVQDLLLIDQVLEDQGVKPSDGYVVWDLDD